MLLQKLQKKKLISPPSWLPDNTIYLTIMGSESYGVATDFSDKDICGICVPPKTIVWPHLTGAIRGFGKPAPNFENWQQHHIEDGKTEYDLAVYSIVRFFHLAMTGSPNICDALFTPRRCILHTTSMGEEIRQKRKIFLSKRMFASFKGYAYSQLGRMNRKPEGKRVLLVEKYGYDIKAAYHLVRLLSEIEQILIEGDLDLEEKGRREHMKAIRRGDITKQEVLDYFAAKEKDIERLYTISKLPQQPDEQKIKELLLNCLEHHYGKIERVISDDELRTALEDIGKIADKFRGA